MQFLPQNYKKCMKYTNFRENICTFAFFVVPFHPNKFEGYTQSGLFRCVNILNGTSRVALFFYSLPNRLITSSPYRQNHIPLKKMT